MCTNVGPIYSSYPAVAPRIQVTCAAHWQPSVPIPLTCPTHVQTKMYCAYGGTRTYRVCTSVSVSRGSLQKFASHARPIVRLAPAANDMFEMQPLPLGISRMPKPMIPTIPAPMIRRCVPIVQAAPLMVREEAALIYQVPPLADSAIFSSAAASIDVSTLEGSLSLSCESEDQPELSHELRMLIEAPTKQSCDCGHAAQNIDVDLQPSLKTQRRMRSRLQPMRASIINIPAFSPWHPSDLVSSCSTTKVNQRFDEVSLEYNRREWLPEANKLEQPEAMKTPPPKVPSAGSSAVRATIKAEAIRLATPQRKRLKIQLKVVVRLKPVDSAPWHAPAWRLSLSLEKLLMFFWKRGTDVLHQPSPCLCCDRW